jgi:hypothetical protein
MPDRLLPLRNGQPIDDEDFDWLYPADVAAHAALHWTPVEVAVRAARHLAPTSEARVLDVGCGPGKFCLVGALTTGACFTGVEQRRHLVAIAKRAALRLGLRNATFHHVNAFEVNWDGYDGFYLFNPFSEQLTGSADGEVSGSFAIYRYYTREAQRRLARVRPGTRVVTYHGFGGEMPTSFDLTAEIAFGDGALEFWVQGHAPLVDLAR